MGAVCSWHAGGAYALYSMRAGRQMLTPFLVRLARRMDLECECRCAIHVRFGRVIPDTTVMEPSPKLTISSTGRQRSYWPPLTWPGRHQQCFSRLWLEQIALNFLDFIF